MYLNFRFWNLISFRKNVGHCWIWPSWIFDWLIDWSRLQSALQRSNTWHFSCRAIQSFRIFLITKNTYKSYENSKSWQMDLHDIGHCNINCCIQFVIGNHISLCMIVLIHICHSYAFFVDPLEFHMPQWFLRTFSVDLYSESYTK